MSSDAKWARVVYQSTVERWKHAESVRMTLTGHFFVAVGLVTTAWATLYGASPTPNKAALCALAVFGLTMSAIFLLMGHRANAFVAGFNELMRQAEESQPVSVLAAPRVMERVNEQRNKLNDQLPFTSSCFVLVVPSVAGIFNVGLLALTLLK